MEYNTGQQTYIDYQRLSLKTKDMSTMVNICSSGSGYIQNKSTYGILEDDQLKN